MGKPIYCSELNLESFEWRHFINGSEPENYIDDSSDYENCWFDQSCNVLYAESLVSQAEADKLVVAKATELRDLFQAVIDRYKSWEELP